MIKEYISTDSIDVQDFIYEDGTIEDIVYYTE